MNQLGTEKSSVDRWRIITFFVIMTAILTFYVLRLFSMQIIEGRSYLAQANANKTREVSIATQRGILYDRNGIVLARNVASYNVVSTPAGLPDIDLLNPNGDVQRIYRELSALIEVPVDNGEINEETVRNFTPCYTDFGIKQIVYIGDTNAPFNQVRIKCNIDPKIAMVIREKTNEWPGVDIEIVSVRDYPTGELTSEVVGFLGPVPASQVDLYEELGFV
jgi:penicillin-binding protein 2